MIRLPPGIPGPDRSHRLLGPRLAAVPTAPVTHEPADLLPQPPEQVPSRDSVILELSTSALKERMALLLERFVPKGWTVLGIGREQGFLAQALAERSPAVGPVDFLAFGDTADPAGALGPMVMIEPVDAVVLDDDVMGLREVPTHRAGTRRPAARRASSARRERCRHGALGRGPDVIRCRDAGPKGGGVPGAVRPHGPDDPASGRLRSRRQILRRARARAALAGLDRGAARTGTGAIRAEALAPAAPHRRGR